MLAAFVSLRLYNLYLTREIYGVLLVAMQILGYLPVFGGGFGLVINQQLLEADDPGTRIATARFRQLLLTYFVAFCLVLGCAIMLAYSRVPAARMLPAGLFLAVGVAGALTLFAGGELALLVGLGRQSTSFVGQALWSLATMALLYLGFRAGGGAWAVPLASIGSAVLVLVVAKIVNRRDHGMPLISWQREADFWLRLRAVWKPSFDWMRSQLQTLVIFTFDLLLVGFLIGPGAAAVYGVVSRIMAMSRQVLGSLCEAAWPRFAQEKEPARKIALMRKVDRLNAWLTGCWYGAMAATLLPFLHGLVKADWVATPWLAGLLLGRSFVVSVVSPHAYGLISLARFRELAQLGQREVIVSTAAALLLGWRAGMEGIALGYLLATVAIPAWQLTRLYFTAMAVPWRREWVTVYLLGGGGGIIACLTARLVWIALVALKMPPPVAAVAAGAIGFGLLGGLPIARELQRRFSPKTPAD